MGRWNNVAPVCRCAGLLLAVLIVGISACKRPELPAVPGLPEALGGLKLTETISGVKANKLLYRMHGRVTGARNSIIGYYGRDRKNALYISAFASKEQAGAALKKMVANVANPATGFSQLTTEKRGRVIIYRTSGMGLRHFFYIQDNLIIWLQAQPEKAEATLTSLASLKFTKH